MSDQLTGIIPGEGKCLVLLRVAQFPKTREGDFPTKDEKCLASNGMTCLLPLSPIYTVTSFSTAKDSKSNLDSQEA